MNVTLIINLLRKHQANSRIELSHLTGLTQATISNIINSLIGIGLVYEYPKNSNGVGRRSVGLALNYDRFHIIHVRVTNTRFSAGRYNLQGKQLDQRSLEYAAGSAPRDMMNLIKAQIAKLIDVNYYPPILGIGIALPGPYNSESYCSSIGELHGWDDIDIRKEFESEFNLPAFAENDANIGALNEWWNDPSITDSDTLVYITTAEGTGSGIVANGTLLRGSQGIAGEIGHMTVNVNGPRCKCGNYGCLELYTSTAVLLEKARTLSAGRCDTLLKPDSTKREFFDACRARDALACEILNEALSYFSSGVINIIYLYNPNLIIFGDEMVTYGVGSELLTYVKKRVKERVSSDISGKIALKLSTSQTDPALLGAGVLVMNNISTILFERGILS
ncbi:MAG: ROK family protein [Oscillospiraceae bacterium]